MNKTILYISLLFLHQAAQTQEVTNQNTSTIFFNGILDKSSQVNRYIQSKAIITPITTAPFEDLKKPTGNNLNTVLHYLGNYFDKPINRINMHMGQSGDIKIAEDICRNKKTPFILYGFSRGGAVAVSAAAASGPELQALVIEGAPYDISRIAYVTKCQLGIPFDHKKLFSYIFPLYDPSHKLNAEAIKNIQNKNLPVLIIHSQPDSAATISEALRYYTHFKREGFENVYLVRLPKGIHGRVITHPEMAPLYLAALHSFYKAYNLPHLEKYARFDISQLKKLFQPNVSTIEKEIEKDDAYLQSLYEESKKRNLTISAALAAIALAGAATIKWFSLPQEKATDKDEKSYAYTT